MANTEQQCSSLGPSCPHQGVARRHLAWTGCQCPRLIVATHRAPPIFRDGRPGVLRPLEAPHRSCCSNPSPAASLQEREEIAHSVSSAPCRPNCCTASVQELWGPPGLLCTHRLPHEQSCPGPCSWAQHPLTNTPSFQDPFLQADLGQVSGTRRGSHGHSPPRPESTEGFSPGFWDQQPL